MTDITMEYIYIYMYKRGTIKIPTFLKPYLQELLGLKFSVTLIALFWAINMLFVADSLMQYRILCKLDEYVSTIYLLSSLGDHST
jgi:hypothetical protein